MPDVAGLAGGGRMGRASLDDDGEGACLEYARASEDHSEDHTSPRGWRSAIEDEVAQRIRHQRTSASAAYPLHPLDDVRVMPDDQGGAGISSTSCQRALPLGRTGLVFPAPVERNHDQIRVRASMSDPTPNGFG